MTRWNSLSAQLKRLLDNPADPIGKDPGKFNDDRLIDILINRWSKLETGYLRNLSLLISARYRASIARTSAY